MSDNSQDGPEDRAEPTLAEEIGANDAATRSMAELSVRKVREIARDEIAAARTAADKKRPRLLKPTTWPRQTIGGSLAAALFGLVMLAVPVLRNAMADTVHSAVGTDHRVMQAFEKPTFVTGVSAALDQLAASAGDGGNPILRYVGETMQQAPVLAFHGERTFGRTFEITLNDTECQERRRRAAETVENAEWEELPVPAGGGIDVVELCEIKGNVDFGVALDIPFHARFFDDGPAAPAHDVWLILFVERKDIEHDTRIGPMRDAMNRPKGLCTVYKPASPAAFDADNPAAELRMLEISRFQPSDSRFYVTKLNGVLEAADAWRERPASRDAVMFLHSVLIDLVRPGEEANSACEGIEAVEDQTVSVRAMVLVNKRVDA